MGRIFLIFFILFFFWVFFLHFKAKVQRPLPFPESRVTPLSSPIPSLSPWDVVVDQFGSSLVPEFSPAGRLISVRRNAGGPGVSKLLKVASFSPNDRAQVRARSQEVLKQVGPLIGISPNWPLGDPFVELGTLSAQAYFKETYQGRPLVPVGSIKIDLGQKGELLGLSSNYATDVILKNQVILSHEEAMKKIQAFFPHKKDSILTSRIGVPVIWITGKDGYYALQFMVRGREIILNQESGKIMMNRDQRHF